MAKQQSAESLMRATFLITMVSAAVACAVAFFWVIL